MYKYVLWHAVTSGASYYVATLISSADYDTFLWGWLIAFSMLQFIVASIYVFYWVNSVVDPK